MQTINEIAKILYSKLNVEYRNTCAYCKNGEKGFCEYAPYGEVNINTR